MNKMNSLGKSSIRLSSVLFLGVLVLYSCSGTTEKKIYETVSVQKRELSTSILATGIVKPKIGAEVKVGSQVSGVLKHLYVRNGDVVQKGDLLAKLEDSELSARYRLELANLDNARTTLKYAAIEKERIKSLLAKDFTSEQTYDNQVKAFDMAVAQLASQQALTDYASIELSFTKIYAPISGVIGSVTTQEGETVSAAFVSPTFVTIIDLSRIEVWAYVDETDIGKVETGQSASFTVDTYPGLTFGGKVTAIYPKAEIRDNVVNYVVILDIDSTHGKQLRPEMTTYVTIVTNSAGKVLCVPNNVIKRQDSATVVYVLENNRPVPKKIRTGIRGNQMTEVTDGLKENEQVLVNNEILTNQ